MSLIKWRTNCLKKHWIAILSVITCILLFSMSWYSYKETDWLLLTLHSRKQNSHSGDDVSYLDHLKDVKIDRMIYEQPEVMKPTRTDVLVLTPWLAPIIWNGTYNIDILNAQFHQRGVRIGLSVFAIKKYIQFIPTFLESAEKFFMVGHPVNYYVFTDQPNNIPNITLGERRQLIVQVVPAYKRWQDISMRRMQIIRDYTRKRYVHEVDYLVCADVDMKFTDHVGVEILSEVFGTIHACYFMAPRKDFTNERRPESAGYVPYDEGDYYYTGSYFGGSIEGIYKLTNYCHHAMLADKEKNIEALWHDESYLNRYFLYHKPTKVLSPEYSCNYFCGEPAAIQRKRFILVPKDYAKVRDKR